mmetsp:Transcript_8941/g.20449  ORF Transcript_8941/g.20449 Transcript_8941/m.20449 type:complete len:237 (-) Transcript_8941:10-720(-)
MEGRDVMLDLHHLAFQHLQRVFERQDLLVELSSLLGSEPTFLLLVHVDLIELLLGEELELGESLLKSKLVRDVGFIVPSVLGNLRLELSLELLGVSDGLDFLLEVRDLRLEGVGFARSSTRGSMSSRNGRDSWDRGDHVLTLEHREHPGLALKAVPEPLGHVIGQNGLGGSLVGQRDDTHDGQGDKTSSTRYHLHVDYSAVGLLALFSLRGSVLLVHIQQDALLLRHVSKLDQPPS